jgi:uroporphyrinogen decarboxylase
MSHRERVLAALNHHPPDRVPIDLGSHSNASIHVHAYKELLSYLGISVEVQLMDRWMQVAKVHERVLDYFDIDTRNLALGRRDRSAEHDLDEESYVDDWGVVRRRPRGSYYYDLVGSPLSGQISSNDILNYPMPDPDDPGITRNLREDAERMRGDTEYAIVLELPSGFVHCTQYLRGFEDWFLDCVWDRKLIELLFDRVLEVNLAHVRHILGVVGHLVDVVETADDIADQRSTIVSPTMYRALIKPRQERYFTEIHKLTSAKLLYHCCGAVYDVLNDFIEVGVDAINPVQVSAAKMNAVSLKAKVSGRLAFWGAIDTYRVLPTGSAVEVRNEVRNRIRELGQEGGYVLSAVHNIQPEVPPENVCAMFHAAREYGVYKGSTPQA